LNVVILLDAALDGPVPPGVAPATLKVYEVLPARPLTVNGEVVPPPVYPPGLDVAVYEIDPLPKQEGAVNATVAVLVPVAVAVPIVGAPGLLGQMPCLV